MSDQSVQAIGVGVAVIIVRDGRVLLGQRHSDPAKGAGSFRGQGAWCLPGGKVHPGETLAEAAKREGREECGVEVDDLQLVSLVDDIAFGKHFVTAAFLAGRASGEPRVLEPDQLTAWQWFSLDDLPQPLFIPTARSLERWRAGTIYRPD